MHNILHHLKKFLETKRNQQGTTPEKILRKQLRYLHHIIKHELHEKKTVETLLKKIQKIEFKKEYAVTKEEFNIIMKERVLEDHAKSFFSEHIGAIVNLFEQLISVVEEQQHANNKQPQLQREGELISQIEELLEQANLEEKQIKEYLHDMKQLPYKKKWINAAQVIAKKINNNMYKLNVEGVDNIPKHGPCILAPHHYHAMIDPVLLKAVVPRTIFFLTSVETYFPMYSEFLKKIGCVPFVRDDEKFKGRKENMLSAETVEKRARNLGADNTTSALRMLRHLKRGHALVIYPGADAEIIGTYKREEGESFLPPQLGMVAIAMLTRRKYAVDVPIIPIGIHYETLHAGFFSRNITMKIGKPIILNQTIQKLTPKNIKHSLEQYNNYIYEQIKTLSK